MGSEVSHDKKNKNFKPSTMRLNEHETTALNKNAMVAFSKN